MKGKIFYDHLIEIEEIEVELDRHEINSDDREELLRIIDENIHHDVLNLILTSLSKEKHEPFLTKFHQTPHDVELLKYLKEEINEEIEERIKEEIKKVKKEVLSEIKRAKK
jgi:hypothetical protein